MEMQELMWNSREAKGAEVSFYPSNMWTHPEESITNRYCPVLSQENSFTSFLNFICFSIFQVRKS